MQGPVARPLPLESELMPDGRSACAQVGSETVHPREPLRDQLPARRRPDYPGRTWGRLGLLMPSGGRPPRARG